MYSVVYSTLYYYFI